MIFKIIKYWLLLCLFFNLAQESEKNIYCNANKHNKFLFDH